MRSYRDLSIKYKLLIGFALLMLPATILFRVNLVGVTSTVSNAQNIVEHENIFSHTIMSMQQSAKKLKALTESFKYDYRAAAVEGTSAGQAKSELLATIDAMVRNSATAQLKDKDQLKALQNINKTKDHYLITVLSLVESSEKKKSEVSDKQLLDTAQAALNLAIDNALDASKQRLNMAIADMKSTLASSVVRYDYNAVAILILTILLSLALASLITKPIRMIIQNSKSIASGNTDSLLAIPYQDEIGKLNDTFISMLIQLENRRKAASLARQAGMAEVAVHVLHNIGNILNNTNTSIAVLKSELSNTPTRNLSLLIEQLKKQEDITTYLKDDERGRMLFSFLENIGKNREQQVVRVTHEMEVLTKSLDLIKNVVASQQKLSRPEKFIEKYKVKLLIDELKEMTVTTMSASDVAYTYDINLDSEIELTCDRSKLQQILHNLVSNAKEAALMGSQAIKKVRVSVGTVGGGGTCCFL